MKICKRIALMLAVLMALSSVLCFSVGAEQTSDLVIGEGREVTFSESGSNGAKKLSFIPQKSGCYYFYAVSENGMWGDITDLDGNSVDAYKNGDHHDGGFESGELYVKAYLNQGETYYLNVESYFSTPTTTGTIFVKETVMPVSGRVVAQANTEHIDSGLIYSLIGLEIEFTMSDGSTELWRSNTDSFDYGCCGYPMDYRYSSETEDSIEYVIECGLAEVKVEYHKRQNLVNYIEYKGSDLVVYSDLTPYVHYSYEMPEDARVVIHYKDGITEEGTLNEIYRYGGLGIYDGQGYAEYWAPDEQNFITIEYFGQKCTIPIRLLPYPEITNVTVNSQPTNNEYYWRDEYIGQYWEDDNEYRIYDYDLTGFSFTLTYADGSTRTFTDADIDMENELIDLQNYSFEEKYYTECGTYETYIEYMGVNIPFTVNVVEDPTVGIKVIQPPTCVSEINSMFAPSLDGMVIRIDTVDGTKHIIATAENTTYYPVPFYEAIFYTIEEGDYFIYGYLDGEGVDVYCRRFEDYYEFEYLDERWVKSIEAVQFRKGIDGSKFKFIYEDGEEEITVVNVVSEMKANGEVDFAYVLESNGKLFYCEGVYNDLMGDISNVRLEMFNNCFHYYTNCAHSFVDVSSNGDATCTADGTKTVECEKCGETDTVADEGSMLPHSGGEATCTAKAVCESCGAEYGSLAEHSDANTDGKCDLCDAEVDTENNGDLAEFIIIASVITLTVISVAVVTVAAVTLAIIWFAVEKKSFADISGIFKKKK